MAAKTGSAAIYKAELDGIDACLAFLQKRRNELWAQYAAACNDQVFWSDPSEKAPGRRLKDWNERKARQVKP